MLEKLIILIIISLSLFSCTRTENGLVFGIPEYEKRDIKVSNIDLSILLKTKELLSMKDSWTRDNLRTCSGNSPYNLYCALEAASNIVDGQYIHRRPALQEVRFTIDDNYKDRWKVHRLADFNSHPNTTYTDVVKVLDVTIYRVKQKLEHYNSFNNAWIYGACFDLRHCMAPVG